MKRRELLTIGGAGLALGTLATAGLSHAAKLGPANGMNAASVADRVEELRLAMLSADRDALEAVLSADVSWGHSNGMIQTREEFVRALVSKSEIFDTLVFDEPSVVMSGTLAIARHTFVSDLRLGAKALSVSLAEVQVWRIEDGATCCIARQAFAL